MQQTSFFAIIVTYNPNIEQLLDTTENLVKQGFEVLIIDNDSKNRKEIIERLLNCKFVLLDQNKAIACALNKGMEESEKYGASWVLSLDQDTRVCSNLLQKYQKWLQLDNIGALCPRVIRKGESMRGQDKGIEMVDICPTAGFFITIDTWKKCGKYDDWMFIDYVDYDLCMKIKIIGKKIYRVNEAFIIQELGKVSMSTFFYNVGNTFGIEKIKNFSRVYNHSPLRNYYFVRNALYYQYKYHDYLDMKYEVNHLLKWEVKKIFLEKNKIANIKAIIKGIYDYRTRIRGLEKR